MQIVYISNRPEVFSVTLQHVALFMPFVEQAVVCVPDSLEGAFKSIVSSLDVNVVLESSVLFNDDLSDFSAMDHQRRNYLLRGQLVRSDSVAPHFIMSDDDARPLKPIALDTFIKGDRYRRYFFYDLASWFNNQTEFDAGQIATCAVLDYENFEHLSYASHMPQVIDKAMFVDAQDFFSGYAKNHPLCEWSTYFNYAPHIFPEKFHPPEPFKTLCWPEHPLAWRLLVEPQSYVFENYTPSIYENLGVFDSAWNTSGGVEEIMKNNIEKLIRWKKYQVACNYPEQSADFRKYLNPIVWINKLFINQ